MTSVNRCLEYTTLPKEVSQDHKHIPSTWPTRGAIHFSNVYLRYRSDLPNVLHDLSFSISPGSKVAIVGRTGAGKSSIVQSLLRLHEIDPDGSIEIDGLDIKDISLTKLRAAISIIPQQPFLFQDTIRKNLNPFDKHLSDSDLWKVLS